MDYFKQEISSSYNQPYFRNKVTNETQWGFKTYYNTKRPLPKGWILLNLDGKPLYKYTKPNKKILPSSYSSYAYAPRELEEILNMSYEDLLDEEEEQQQAEACRRYNLFQKVARLLKLRADSICDESLEFLARKANVPVEQIIAYIEETERKELGEKAILTPFSTIKRTDSSFSSERSIREICGVNTKEVEAQKAMSQIRDQFTCVLSQNAFTDPVMCSSGHTFEREYITRLIRMHSNPVCPNTRIPLTGQIVPNYALRKVIDEFIETYKNQKGAYWAPILEFCVTYIGYSGRLQVPIDVTQTQAPRFQRGESLISSSPSRLEVDRRSPRIPHLGIEDSMTGRNPDEIRNYMIAEGYDIDVIDNIPEVISSSRDSSYNHALDEANRRLVPAYREAHRSRTAEELLEYFINLNPQHEDLLSTAEAYDVAVQTANSPYNSYARASRSPFGSSWFINPQDW